MVIKKKTSKAFLLKRRKVVKLDNASDKIFIKIMQEISKNECF